MPVEKSGQNEFDFQYGEQFGDHIESFDPDFAKVLVRYNPDGDADMNARQTERLRRLADWLHDHDRKFLFELLVPAEDHQLESVGGDTRPLRRRAAPRADAAHDRRATARRGGGRRVEDRGRGRARRLRDAGAPVPRAAGATGWCACVLGRGADDDKVDHWLHPGRAGGRLRGLCHRPLDLVATR